MTTVVAGRRAYNTNGDNQVLYDHALGSDNVKVSIIEPLECISIISNRRDDHHW